MEATGWSDLRTGPQAKECRLPLEAEKSKKMGSPLKPPEETSPDDTLPLGQWNWFETSDPQNWTVVFSQNMCDNLLQKH